MGRNRRRGFLVGSLTALMALGITIVHLQSREAKRRASALESALNRPADVRFPIHLLDSSTERLRAPSSPAEGKTVLLVWSDRIEPAGPVADGWIELARQAQSQGASVQLLTFDSSESAELSELLKNDQIGISLVRQPESFVMMTGLRHAPATLVIDGEELGFFALGALTNSEIGPALASLEASSPGKTFHLPENPMGLMRVQ